MKLKDAREHYYTFSASLSGVNRQLCFAGIAVIWVFAVDSGNGQHALKEELLWSLGCFVLGLVMDLFHYATSAATWAIFHRIHEKRGIGEDTDFGAPIWINWMPCILFWLKTTATIIGYIILLSVIGDMIIIGEFNE